LQDAEERQTLPDVPIQSEGPEESISMLPLMPDLPSPDLDTQSDDKKMKYISARTGYHSAGFYDPYSDHDNSLLDDKEEDKEIELEEVVDNKKGDEEMVEVVDVLMNLKTVDGLPTDKTKAKPTKKKRNHCRPLLHQKLQRNQNRGEKHLLKEQSHRQKKENWSERRKL
jgi:hypothetical protein